MTDTLGQRVSAAEIAIDGANSKITLKADKIDLDALITKVNGLTTGGVKAKSLYTEKLIVTNNYVHIGEKDGSWKTYTAVTDFTQASGESAPSADATVLAAAIGDGGGRDDCLWRRGVGATLRKNILLNCWNILKPFGHSAGMRNAQTRREKIEWIGRSATKP